MMKDKLKQDNEIRFYQFSSLGKYTVLLISGFWLLGFILSIILGIRCFIDISSYPFGYRFIFLLGSLLLISFFGIIFYFEIHVFRNILLSLGINSKGLHFKRAKDNTLQEIPWESIDSAVVTGWDFFIPLIFFKGLKIKLSALPFKQRYLFILWSRWDKEGRQAMDALVREIEKKVKVTYKGVFWFEKPKYLSK